MSTLEGLEVSAPPCAEVLSVAGFLAIMGRFSSERRFILRGREALLGAERPPLLNLAARSVKPACQLGRVTQSHSLANPAVYSMGSLPTVCREAYTRWWVGRHIPGGG